MLRYILEKLSSCGHLQLCDPGSLVSREHSFPSKYITEVERDGRMPVTASTWRHSASLGVLVSWLGEQERTDRQLVENINVLQSVCAVVSERSD